MNTLSQSHVRAITKLKKANEEIFHLKKLKEFREKSSEINNLIKQLNYKTKSLDWDYIEYNISDTFIEEKPKMYIQVIPFLESLDVITQSLNAYDTELTKNIISLVRPIPITASAKERARIEIIRKENMAIKTLCEMNMLDETMKNYESEDDDADEADEGDEGYPLVRTCKYNLRPRN
jgi:hypothetical protein